MFYEDYALNISICKYFGNVPKWLKSTLYDISKILPHPQYR